ncbi:MAG: hypothetical protein WCQ99_15975, partial [Pseudomonadota bacterium]
MAKTTTRATNVHDEKEKAIKDSLGDRPIRLIKAKAEAGGKLKIKKAAEKPKAALKEYGIKKQYLKSACKVQFRLPETFAPDANTVCIAGDFNGWD